MAHHHADRGLARMARELHLNAESLISVLPFLTHRPYIHDKVVKCIHELHVAQDKLTNSQDMSDHRHGAHQDDNRASPEYLRKFVPKTSQERQRDIEALEVAIPTVTRCQPQVLLIALRDELSAEKKRLEVMEATSRNRDMAQ